ncbi:hypothetical protein CLV51_103429 [Chitinophaga niastensis]|uniref:Tetratricopeptide repeat protein n=1 Tax=Chitinophaga niastensis TaxID=536980 RepID=A0A2P8HJU9_CHINA|nr:hypothetical protein [Chitinophaga niastensis]PSL46450.1 hypothetical protein CLV51_103429 [Chitinophaga niastensis]
MTANRIIAHVFLQPNLQQVDETVMEQLVADHPYFSAARLLLAKKVCSYTGDLHSPAVKKALLYTSQQHHLYQFLAEEPGLQEAEDRIAAMIVIPEDNIEPVVAKTITAVIPEAIHIPEPEATVVIPELVHTFEPEAPVVVPELIHSPEPEAAIVIPEVTIPERVTIAAIGDFEPAAFNTTKTTAPEEIIETPPIIIPPVIESKRAIVADESPESTEPIKIFPLALPVEEETVLTFQPLYTDDYFAYKRLKNPGAADELNEQGAAEMKSFTSWLRQMKDSFAGKASKDWYHQQLHKIYEEDEEPEVSETVEKMAMSSITFNNDIVSETLAEIWVRQHQYGNAIKIYQKLSLLNPDKNAYFAQKIVELKSKTDKNK